MIKFLHAFCYCNMVKRELECGICSYIHRQNTKKKKKKFSGASDFNLMALHQIQDMLMFWRHAVIVRGNGIGDPISNPRWGCWWFILKVTNLSVLLHHQ